VQWVADLLAGLSLVAVVIIGWLTLQLGRRSTDASERSATAAIQAAEATERSVGASEQSAEASLQAAQATERSVAASEAAARLAAQDARMRRVEAVLDVVLEMRALFNDQVKEAEGPWVPAYGSTEALARLALSRRLEARLVPFEEEIQQGSDLSMLTTTFNWSSTNLESTITLLKPGSRRRCNRAR
jgi:hypothetical protein